MTLLPIDHMANISGFISTSTSDSNNQTWQNGRPWCTDLVNENVATTYESLEKHVCLYLQFWKNYYFWKN